MGRMHLSLSLSEGLTQDCLELGQDSRYLTMENIVRACIVFTKAHHDFLDELNQKLENLKIPSNEEPKLTAPAAERVAKARAELLFGYKNFSQAVLLQLQEGILLRDADRLKD